MKAGRLPTAGVRRPDATEDALLRQTGVIRVPTLAGPARHRPPAHQPAAARRASGRRARQRRRLARHRRRRRARRRPASWPSWRRRRRPRWPTLAPHAGRRLGVVDLGLARPAATTCERAVAALGRRPRGRRVLVLYAAWPRRHRRRGGGGRSRSGARRAPRSRWSRASTGPSTDTRSGRRRARCSTPSTPPPARSAGSAAYAEWLAAAGGRAADARRRARRRRRAALVQEHLERRTPGGSASRRRWRVLDAVGLPTLPHRGRRRRGRGAGGGRARSGYPVVLKAAGRDRTAKTAAAGFAIDLEGPDAAAPRVGADGGRRSATRSCRCWCSRWSGRASTWPSAVRDHPTVGPGALARARAGRRRPSTPPPTCGCCPLTDLDAARLVAGSRLAPLLDDPPGAPSRRRCSGRRRWSRRCPRSASSCVNPVIVRDGAPVITQAVATRGRRSSATRCRRVRRV